MPSPDLELRLLKRWTMPRNYFGKEWHGYWVAPCGRSRDSDSVEEANWRAMLRALGWFPSGTEGVEIVRERHFLCGWVEWIAIHEDRLDLLREAERIAERLEQHPVLDEDTLSWVELEEEGIPSLWRTRKLERARRSDPETSKAAAESLPSFSDVHAKLLAAFEEAGRAGLTDEEACEAAGMLEKDGWWRRCSELRALGLIRPTGESRASKRTGRARMVCEVTRGASVRSGGIHPPAS